MHSSIVHTSIIITFLLNFLLNIFEKLKMRVSIFLPFFVIVFFRVTLDIEKFVLNNLFWIITQLKIILG
jgi:hypothetical protein